MNFFLLLFDWAHFFISVLNFPSSTLSSLLFCLILPSFFFCLCSLSCLRQSVFFLYSIRQTKFQMSVWVAKLYCLRDFRLFDWEYSLFGTRKDFLWVLLMNRSVCKASFLFSWLSCTFLGRNSVAGGKVTEPPIVLKRSRSATEKGEIAPIDLTASNDGWRILWLESLLWTRIFLRGVALITSRSRSDCAHPSALPRRGRKSCMSARHVTIPTRSTPQKIRQSKPLCIDIKPSKEQIREVDYIDGCSASHPKRAISRRSYKRPLIFQKEADRGHRRTYRED